MSSVKTSTRKSQRYLNLSLALAGIAMLCAGVSPAQQLRQGISVQMAPTTHAADYPAADNADAWIVTITAEGQLYFGVKPVTPDQLAEEMKATPRRRDARLYIKADARASFKSVKEALKAAHDDLFETAVLLSAQQAPTARGAIVQPQGLVISLALPSAMATVVHLQSSGQPTIMRVNDQETSWADLQSALHEGLQRDNARLVVIEADSDLPFAQVVKIIDASRFLGAKVAVSLMKF